MAATNLDLDRLAAELASFTITPTNAIQISQMKHRLAVLAAWFGGLQRALDQLGKCRIIELGCGQGDMTVALAHAVSEQKPSSEGQTGRVLAIDPAPLDYGSPYTLGQSQGHLAKSQLAHAIQWIQKDPIDYLRDPIQADYIVLAHSLFYLPSVAYFKNLSQSLHANASRRPDEHVKPVLANRRLGTSAPKLLLAEWGMKASTDAAAAHVFAVQAQMKCPKADANVRTVMDPAHIISLAREAGWVLESEQWIEKPDLDDGSWEVSAARDIRDDSKDSDNELEELLTSMEDSIKKHNGSIASMDVWTAVFTTS